MLKKFIFILFLSLFLHATLMPHMHMPIDTKKPAKLAIPGYSTVRISPERLHLFGITTEKVAYKKLIKSIRTVGIAEVDETKISHVQTKFNGWIENLYVDFIGMPVKIGHPLFSVYSPELVATQEEYIAALADIEDPVEGKFKREFEKSSTNLIKASADRLSLWDISDEQIRQIEQSRMPFKTLLFRSPIDGIVLDKKAFIGMNVAPGMTIYNIADLSHVWVLADIYESDVDLIQLGQEGEIYFSSMPKKIFKTEITFLDYVLENKTRTMKARFEIANKDMKLKPGMFATVNIKVNLGTTLALPEESLIHTGKRKIIFVEKERGTYEPREVKIGFKAQNYYQILSGISEGEKVVTSAQFLLDSESRLKALTAKVHSH